MPHGVLGQFVPSFFLLPFHYLMHFGVRRHLFDFLLGNLSFVSSSHFRYLKVCASAFSVAIIRDVLDITSLLLGFVVYKVFAVPLLIQGNLFFGCNTVFWVCPECVGFMKGSLSLVRLSKWGSRLVLLRSSSMILVRIGSRVWEYKCLCQSFVSVTMSSINIPLGGSFGVRNSAS